MEEHDLDDLNICEEYDEDITQTGEGENGLFENNSSTDTANDEEWFQSTMMTRTMPCYLNCNTNIYKKTSKLFQPLLYT